MLRNLKARATSMKPRTIFTRPSQLPLLNFFSTVGKRASRVKGRAKATEKASMVTMGVQNCPWVDLMRTVPTMGPVQEKDTSTRVRAMKKTPTRPPRSAFLSLLLTREEGRVISKAPKKEAAKMRKTAKKMRLGSQWVANQLNISAVTAAPPIRRVRPMMRQMGTVYSRTMNNPYIKALKRPAAGEADPLRKKDTVIGTIGKTHGVSSMASPQRMASRTRAQREPPAVPLSSETGWASCREAVWVGIRGISKPQFSGAAHRVSLQLFQVMDPFRTAPSPAVRTCWTSTMLRSKINSPEAVCRGSPTSCSAPSRVKPWGSAKSISVAEYSSRRL